MKVRTLNVLRSLVSDKLLLTLSIGIIVVFIAYAIYVALSVTPTEVQIATRYTSFGDVQFYRSKWYQLYLLIGLAAVMAVVHIGATAKLLDRNMRSLAVALCYFTFLMFAIIFMITHSIFDIAFLS